MILKRTSDHTLCNSTFWYLLYCFIKVITLELFVFNKYVTSQLNSSLGNQGVPQSSSLGPLFFIIGRSPFGQIPTCHSYAESIQTYIRTWSHLLINSSHGIRVERFVSLPNLKNSKTHTRQSGWRCPLGNRLLLDLSIFHLLLWVTF